VIRLRKRVPEELERRDYSRSPDQLGTEHISADTSCIWVIYPKKPLGGPGARAALPARYTHRVAISNHRLLAMADRKVTFRWKDYAHGGKRKCWRDGFCAPVRAS
jgi:hypothetical protein